VDVVDEIRVLERSPEALFTLGESLALELARFFG
jgi:hypothetical protein